MNSNPAHPVLTAALCSIALCVEIALSMAKKGKKIQNCLQYATAGIRKLISMDGLRFAVGVALCPALAAPVVYITDKEFDYLTHVLPEKEVYTGLSSLVALCVVFHTVQSYSRFMSGLTMIYQFFGSLHETAAMCIIFSKHSKASKDKTDNFLHTLVRLMSLLFALCLAELEDDIVFDERRSLSCRVLHPEGLDSSTLKIIYKAHDKPMCAYHKILDLMVDALGTGVVGVPPPIYTRCFAELDNGLGKFHECLKFKEAPFPFPFMVVTETLLCVFTVFTPFMFAKWAAGPGGSAIFTFITIFCIWLLHCVAEELENPFGHDSGDLNCEKIMSDLNIRLVSVLEEAVTNSPYSTESIYGKLGARQSQTISHLFSKCVEVMTQDLQDSGKILIQNDDSQNQTDLSASAESASSADEDNLQDDRTTSYEDQPANKDQAGQQVQDCSSSPTTEIHDASAMDGPPALCVSMLTPRLVPWRVPSAPEPFLNEACHPQTPLVSPRHASEAAAPETFTNEACQPRSPVASPRHASDANVIGSGKEVRRSSQAKPCSSNSGQVDGQVCPEELV